MSEAIWQPTGLCGKDGVLKRAWQRCSSYFRFSMLLLPCGSPGVILICQIRQPLWAPKVEEAFAGESLIKRPVVYVLGVRIN